MAYDIQNPPIRHTNRVGGGTYWWYESDDSIVDMAAAGYITNARYLKMEAGDILIRVDSDGVPAMLAVEEVLPNGSATLKPQDTSTIALPGGGTLLDGILWTSILETGAVPDWNGTTGTDNVVAIQAAIDRASLTGRGVWIPEGEFAYSAQITNVSLVPIAGPGTLVFTGSGEDAFVFGALGGNANQYNTSLPSCLRVKRATVDWTDDFAGIVVAQCFNLKHTFDAVNFRCGLSLEASTGGCAYNSITLGRFQECATGHRLWVRTGSDGYVNQNTFYAGRWGGTTNTAHNLQMCELKKEGSNAINGNVWYNPSIEGTNSGAGLVSGWRGVGSGTVAEKNSVFGLRLETDAGILLAGTGLVDNVFHFTYPDSASPNTSASLISGDTDADNLLLARNRFTGTDGGVEFSDRLIPLAVIRRENLVALASNSQVCAPAFGIWGQSSSQILARPGTLGANTFRPNNQTNIIGVKLDFTAEPRPEFRKVIIVTKSPTAAHGRIAATCIDGSAAYLSDAAACTLGYNAGLGIYRSGADGTGIAINGSPVIFGPDVAQAVLGIANGSTTNADIEEIAFYVPLRSGVRLVYDALSAGLDIGEPAASSIPAVSTGDKVGTFCRNIGAGTEIGWRFNGTAWIPVYRQAVSADKGDAAATLTVGTSESTSVWNTPLAANRAVTLSTTNAVNGAKFRVVRTAAATGAFALNVGTGPLAALDPGEWCDVEYDGSAWILTAFGALA